MTAVSVTSLFLFAGSKRFVACAPGACLFIVSTPLSKAIAHSTSQRNENKAVCSEHRIRFPEYSQFASRFKDGSDYFAEGKAVSHLFPFANLCWMFLALIWQPFDSRQTKFFNLASSSVTSASDSQRGAHCFTMSMMFAPPFGELRLHAMGRAPTAIAKRQDSQCDQETTGTSSDSIVPLTDTQISIPNGSPTITMTKTLYSAGQITSTQAEGSSSTGEKAGTTTSLLQSFSLNATPFMGVALTLSNVSGVSAQTQTQANASPPTDGTVTTTGTSIIYSTITLISMRTSTTTVHDSSASATNSHLVSLIGSNQSSTAVSSSKSGGSTTTSSITANSNSARPASHSGTIAGATIGTMAAFGMIGFLLWFCCVKKKARHKLKLKLNLKRRKSSSAKTAQLENQSMEEIRRTMLEQHNNNVNDFLKSAPASAPPPRNPLAVELPAGDNTAAFLPVPLDLRRTPSETESGRTHPSWIGVAVTSNTPPATPPLPRSNSQKTTTTFRSATATSTDGYRYAPSPLSAGPNDNSFHQRIPSSLLPIPLQAAMKPAPIITTPSLARPEHVSPLSPRGMFNSLGNTTSKAWQRASQVLSPSAYSRLGDDAEEDTNRVGRSSVSIGAGGSAKRRDSKPRNPELEIGHQADGRNGKMEGWI